MKSCIISNIFSSMMPVVKAVLVTLVIALSLTSDTASQLVKLREHWPNAKILGVSELDIASSHAPVRVNPWMNELRSRLSDLP